MADKDSTAATEATGTQDDAGAMSVPATPADALGDTSSPLPEHVTGSILITGAIPEGEKSVTASVRVSATVDLVFSEGQLIEIGFNAAQYTVVERGGEIAVRSSFPPRLGASVVGSK